jgi:flagellar protein FlaG
MATTTGEIQPVAGSTWVTPAVQKKQVQSVSRVGATGGSTASKVQNSDNSKTATATAKPFITVPGMNAEDFQEIENLLQENANIGINVTVDGDGKSVVQLLDSDTGEVIRQIPPEQLAQIRNNPGKLSGLLFDSQA